MGRLAILKAKSWAWEKLNGMFRIIFVRHQKLWHQLLALTSPFSAVPPDNRCPRIFRFLFCDFQWVYAVLIHNNQVFFHMWNCERQNSEDIEGEGPSRFKNWLCPLWTTSSWAVDKLPHASVSSSPHVIVRVKTQENPWLIRNRSSAATLTVVIDLIIRPFPHHCNYITHSSRATVHFL